MWEQHPRNLLPRSGQVTERRTGDDGTHQAGWPGTTRMVDCGDGTVYDRVSGLWIIKDHAAMGSPWDATMDWPDAIDNCLALTYAGHADWRLPNIVEAFGLCDYAPTAGPCIQSPLVVVNDQYYWTGTQRPSAPGAASAIIRWAGYAVTSADVITALHYALPVRGGRVNG
jgi:hypothetical protein